MRLLSIIALILVSGPAFADSVTLTNDVLARIQSVTGGQDRLRVNLSRKLIIERSTDGGTDVVVDDDGVDVVLREKILKETVGTGVSGRIVAIEGAEVTSGAALDRKLIYVSFDADCNAKECAFGFARAYDDARGGNRVFLSTDYLLAAIPTDADYRHSKVFSKKVFLKKQLTLQYGVYLPVKGTNSRAIRLELDEDEYREVVRESRRHRGVPDAPEAPPAPPAQPAPPAPPATP